MEEGSFTYPMSVFIELSSYTIEKVLEVLERHAFFMSKWKNSGLAIVKMKLSWKHSNKIETNFLVHFHSF